MSARASPAALQLNLAVGTDMAGKKGQAPRVEFSQALFDRICDLVGDGKSVREVCELSGMPDRATFNGWRKRTPELQDQYALCRVDREDAIFDDILWISDNEKDSKKAKVMIDAREWTLARMNGKKYGNRTMSEITGADGAAMQLVLNGSDVHG
jgi:hypothetical protein